MRYPNQKKIIINDVIPCDEQHPYKKFNIEVLEQAARNLTGEQFKMWVYFYKNHNGYEFNLSVLDCDQTWGIKKDTYYRNIKRLIELSYLEPIEERSGEYRFNAIPIGEKKEEREEIFVPEEKRKIEEPIEEKKVVNFFSMF